jgi:hypothetical protein
MKVLNITALLALAILEICNQKGVGSDSIEIGETFTSPDGRFTAQLANDDNGDLGIKNNQTGETYKVGALTPLLSLKWTGDSKTIVTVEHIAGGSEANLVHFDGSKWNQFSADPPGDTHGSRRYEVVRQQVDWKRVKFVYKVTDEKSNGEVIKFYTCSFEVNPQTNIVSNVVKREIDRSTYAALHYKK